MLMSLGDLPKQLAIKILKKSKRKYGALPGGVASGLALTGHDTIENLGELSSAFLLSQAGPPSPPHAKTTAVVK